MRKITLGRLTFVFPDPMFFTLPRHQRNMVREEKVYEEEKKAEAAKPHAILQ